MASSKNFSDLCMVVHFERGRYGDRFAHINASVHRVDDGYFSSCEEGGHLRGLAIESQTDAESLSGQRNTWGKFNSPMYAVKIVWNDASSTHANTLESMETGVKTLRPIHKYLDKIDEKYGPAGSFGAFIQRVCQAAGIDQIKLRGYCSRDRDEAISLETARLMIDAQIREWQREETESAAKTA